jgi:hypothetical protein
MAQHHIQLALALTIMLSPSCHGRFMAFHVKKSADIHRFIMDDAQTCWQNKKPQTVFTDDCSGIRAGFRESSWSRCSTATHEEDAHCSARCVPPRRLARRTDVPCHPLYMSLSHAHRRHPPLSLVLRRLLVSETVQACARRPSTCSAVSICPNASTRTWHRLSVLTSQTSRS